MRTFHLVESDGFLDAPPLQVPRRFRPGDAFLADDTTGSGHITRFLAEVTALFVPVVDIPE